MIKNGNKMMCMGFSKAFDKVLFSGLIKAVMAYGIQTWLVVGNKG